MTLIGAHTGAAAPLAAAAALGADLVQIFLGNPQSWKKPPPRPDAAELLAADLSIYVHAPYLMNLASPNNRIRIPSRTTLRHAGEAAAAIGAAGLVVHGGHVGDDEDIAVGYERWRKALEAYDAPVPVLVENTAGGGNAVLRDLEGYGPLWQAIGEFGVGAVLDTCHAWAGGNDLETAVDVVAAATGSVSLVHCNDSRDPHDSRRDRHANLGEGLIPPQLLVHVVRSAAAPVVVETPAEDGGQQRDIAWLRQALAVGDR